MGSERRIARFGVGVGRNQNLYVGQRGITQAGGIPIPGIGSDGLRRIASGLPYRLHHRQQLFSVVGLLCYLRGDNDLGMSVGGYLRIVGLRETLPAIVLHHAGVRVHEVVLPGGFFGIVQRSAKLISGFFALLWILAWLGRGILLARAASFARCVVLPGGFQLLLGLPLQFCLGLPEALQSALRAGQFSGQRIGRLALAPTLVLLLIGMLRLGKQPSHGFFPVTL